MSSTLLDWSPATDPFPLQASPSTGNLQSCKLTVIGSNPSPDPANNPVTIQGVQVTIPLGEGGSALTNDSTDIGPVPPDGWKLQPGTPAGVYTFIPPGGSVQVGADSLLFTFNGIYVNRQPGYVQGLQVMEGSGGCVPPNCPTAPLSVTKFPTGWGQVNFWVTPANIPAGQDVTLHWQGPQGATYQIEYAAGTRVVNIPAAGAPPLSNNAVYPGTADPPLQPAATTTFTLTVTDTIDGVQYTAQDQQTVTVLEPAPTITCFKGAVSFDPGTGACTLMFNWTTSNADHCSMSGLEEQLKPNSDPPGLPIPLTSPGAENFTLTAINSVGQVSSTLSLQWGITSQVGGMPGPRAGLALSPDGTLLYIAGGNTFAVYERPVVPGTAPTQLRSGPGQFSGDGFQAVAPGPSGGIWCYTETEPGTFAICVVEDGETPLVLDNAVAVPGYGVLFQLAMSLSEQVLYFSNGDAGDVYAFTVNAPGSSRPVDEIGSVNTGMEAACGVAVSPQSNVYSATTISAIVYAPQSGSTPLVQKGSRQITQGWDGNTMQALAFGGNALWVLATNWAVPCDPTSLAPLRDPVGMGASAIACTADGMRLYVINWGNATLYEFAPTALTGGVPC